jgi:hypothetical protein
VVVPDLLPPKPKFITLACFERLSEHYCHTHQLPNKKEAAPKDDLFTGARLRKLMTTIQLELSNGCVPIEDSVAGLKLRSEPESAVVHGVHGQPAVVSPTG